MKTKTPNAKTVARDRAELVVTFGRAEDFLTLLKKADDQMIHARSYAETVLLSRKGMAYMRTDAACARAIAKANAELVATLEMVAEKLCAKLARTSKTAAAKRAA